MGTINCSYPLETRRPARVRSDNGRCEPRCDLLVKRLSSRMIAGLVRSAPSLQACGSVRQAL